jgi:hypothetical protein
MRLFILRRRDTDYLTEFDCYEQIILATNEEEAIEIAKEESEGIWRIYNEIDMTQAGVVSQIDYNDF